MSCALDQPVTGNQELLPLWKVEREEFTTEPVLQVSTKQAGIELQLF